MSRGAQRRIIRRVEVRTAEGGFMFVAALVLALAIPQAAQTPRQPPRDPAAARTTVLDPTARETALQTQIAASPNAVAAYIELAKLQENRGAFDEAELTLTRARGAAPSSKEAALALIGLYNRKGDFTKTIEMLDV